MRAVTDAVLRNWPLPEIADTADKTQRGTMLIVAGGAGMAGAAVLAGTAALRAGAGRIQILSARQHADALGVALPEARVIASVEQHPGAADVEDVRTGFDAVLIGPGLDERSACAFATRFLDRGCKCPVILDAGAIPAIRQIAHDGTAVLVTPHAGELAHLFGTDKDEILHDPSGAAHQAAQRWGAGVVLKGAVTHLSLPESGQWRHEGGNCGLATAGSGDVLAGVITGLGSDRSDTWPANCPERFRRCCARSGRPQRRTSVEGRRSVGRVVQRLRRIPVGIRGTQNAAARQVRRAVLPPDRPALAQQHLRCMHLRSRVLERGEILASHRRAHVATCGHQPIDEFVAHVRPQSRVGGSPQATGHDQVARVGSEQNEVAAIARRPCPRRSRLGLTSSRFSARARPGTGDMRSPGKLIGTSTSGDCEAACPMPVVVLGCRPAAC